MSDEIKEILDYLKNNKFIPDETKRKYKILHKDEVNKLLDYITNLQEENKELLKKSYSDDVIITKAVEYITSYEAISTIQGLDKIEQNKKIDERTMNVMVERYLKVHHNLLNILQGTDDSNLQDH